MEKVERFIQGWTNDGLSTKPVFVSLLRELLHPGDVDLEFHERPGISYSLRGMHDHQKERPLFVMIDVIDDDPDRRWLSVCFYGDMIEDPEELGDLIPEGLLGADGYCFDIDGVDGHRQDYLQRRIREAYRNACNSR